jgi:DNA (cytosine-5)-methyltransferase 1
MRIGSLFSGIGGLELGLEWAGVGHTEWQVERDEYCRRVLAKHWPNVKRFNDVREVGAHNLSPVDVICGGFPCQDISYAGKGLGLAGARSGLWYEFARIVGEMGPRYVVVENVRALLTRGLDQVLGTLADLGYDAEWSIVSACSVGAPHPRQRVFILAYANGEQLGGIRSHGDGAGADCGRDGISTRRPVDAERAKWAEESNLDRVLNGVSSRLDRARNKSLGNAVVPQVAEIVGRRLLQIHRGLGV